MHSIRSSLRKWSRPGKWPVRDRFAKGCASLPECATTPPPKLMVLMKRKERCERDGPAE